MIGSYNIGKDVYILKKYLGGKTDTAGYREVGKDEMRSRA